MGRGHDPTRVRWVVGGYLALGLVAVVGLILAASSRPTPRADVTPAVAPGEVADTPQRVRGEFEAVFDRAVKRLGAMPPETLPPVTHSSAGVDGSDERTVHLTLSGDPSARFRHDVVETKSLVNPYTGSIAFGVKYDGRMTGTTKYWSKSTSSPFPTLREQTFKLDVAFTVGGEALYDYRNGRWSLRSVRLTPTDRRVHSAGDANDLFSMMVAADMRANGGLTVVKTETYAPESRLKVVRVFDEAVYQ